MFEAEYARRRTTAEAEAGRAVLVISHRPALLDAADRVVRVEAAA